MTSAIFFMHLDVVNKFNLDRPSTRALISRASVVEPWRIVTAIHTRDPEKDLHMKDQEETASGKRECDLKDNRPGNVQDRHILSSSSSSSAKKSRTSASQSSRSAKHSQRQDSASPMDARSGSNGGDYSSRIDSRQPTSNGVLDRRIDCLENAIKQIAAHMGLFQCQHFT